MKKLLVGLVVLCCSGTVLAQGTPRQEEDKIVYKKVTTIDIGDGAPLTGEIVKPSGCYIPARKRAAFKNLIEIRASFAPEMTQSVAGL